jgi:hypothetical protein
MAYIRKSLARVAATVVIGGMLSLAGVVVASPASATTAISAPRAVVQNIPLAPAVKDPCLSDPPPYWCF